MVKQKKILTILDLFPFERSHISKVVSNVKRWSFFYLMFRLEFIDVSLNQNHLHVSRLFLNWKLNNLVGDDDNCANFRSD